MNGRASTTMDTLSRHDWKELVDAQIVDIKAFTESPECTDNDLHEISIHLAVMMAKISSKPAATAPVTRQTPRVLSTTSSKRVWMTSALKIGGALGKPRSPRTKNGEQVQDEVSGAEMGSLVPANGLTEYGGGETSNPKIIKEDNASDIGDSG